MPDGHTQFDINWMESVQYTLEQIAEEAKRKNGILDRIATALEKIELNNRGK